MFVIKSNKKVTPVNLVIVYVYIMPKGWIYSADISEFTMIYLKYALELLRY